MQVRGLIARGGQAFSIFRAAWWQQDRAALARQRLAVDVTGRHAPIRRLWRFRHTVNTPGTGAFRVPGVRVRALTRRAEAMAALSANVEVVTGDLTVPESLDAGLRGAGAVFLVWAAPPATAPAVVERLATCARRVVFLSSPH